MGGTREYDGIPLQGTIGPRYATMSANLDISKSWPSLGGAGVAVKTDMQAGTDGTPSGAQFALGGPGRGSNYHTGTASAPSGGYGGIEISSPVWSAAGAVLQGYVGYNGAFAEPSRAEPSVGGGVHTASAEVGLRAQLSDQLSAGISVSRPVDANPNPEKKMNFFVSASF
jgi:hemolysin activation/secretion protein